MAQIKPTMEAELRTLADRTQAEQMPIVSAAMLALVFIYYARNVIRFGADMPVWNYIIGATLLLATAAILILANLNRIPEKYSQAVGVTLLMMHGIATYSNLVLGSTTGIYASAFTVLALSMCVLSMQHFQLTLFIYLLGWLAAVNIGQEPAEWMPTLLLLVIVSGVSYLALRFRLRALMRYLILESRVQELEAYLPMCASCNNIREKSGRWVSLEAYMETNQGKKISHGVCPSCKDDIYGDYLAKRKQKRQREEGN